MDRTDIIDLGEVGADGYELAEHLPRSNRRTLTAAGLVLSCLISLTAAQPGTPVLQELWSGEVSLAGFTVGPTVVVLSEPGAQAIVGRDLWTGRPHWQLDLDSSPQYTVDTGEDASAVVMMSLDESTGDFELTTTLVDGAGRILTQLRGYQLDLVVSDDLLLVMAQLPAGAPGCTGEAECVDVPALDRATGTQLWRQRLPGTMVRTIRSAARPVSSFATVRPGAVDIRELTTGVVRDRIAVPTGLNTDLLMYDQMLVTAERGRYEAVVTGYRVRPVETAWTVRIPVSEAITVDTAWFFLSGCGGFVCLHSDGASTVIEPATGVTHGQVNVDVVGQVPGLLLAQPSVERRSRTVPREVYLLAAAGGHPLSTLADAVVVRWHNSGGRALVAQQGSHRTAFIWWDADGGEHQLGSVIGTDLTCRARAEVLVCSDTAGHLRAWHLPV